MLTTASGQRRVFSAVAAANGCQEQGVHKPLQKVRAISQAFTGTTPAAETENGSGYWWWIGAPWLIGGIPVPKINRQARIHRASGTGVRRGVGEHDAS